MGLYKVRTLWTGGNGGNLVSTMFFEESGGTAAQANAAVGAFWNALKSSIVDDLTFATDSSVYLIDEATGQPTGLNAVTPVTAACTQSGDPLPFMSQAVCQWRTGVFIAGREIRGRTFIPGMSETNSTNGRPVAGLVTAVNAAAAALIADANSIFGVYSLQNFNFQEAVLGSCWSEFGVLRSRRT